MPAGAGKTCHKGWATGLRPRSSMRRSEHLLQDRRAIGAQLDRNDRHRRDTRGRTRRSLAVSWCGLRCYFESSHAPGPGRKHDGHRARVTVAYQVPRPVGRLDRSKCQRVIAGRDLDRSQCVPSSVRHDVQDGELSRVERRDQCARTCKCLDLDLQSRSKLRGCGVAHRPQALLAHPPPALSARLFPCEETLHAERHDLRWLPVDCVDACVWKRPAENEAVEVADRLTGSHEDVGIFEFRKFLGQSRITAPVERRSR